MLILVVASRIFLVNESSAQQKELQTVSARFSLSVSIPDAAVKVGAPIWVIVTKENTSDQNLSVYRAIAGDSDQGGWVYRVIAQDEKGRKAPKTKFGRHVQGPETADEAIEPASMVGSGGYIPLAPHKSISDRINIGKLYDLTHAGKYTVQVQEFDEESKTYVKSNPITVTVTP